jgi:hypothetical protein
LDTYHPDTLYLHEQGCENPWLLFKAERGPQEISLGNTAVVEYLPVSLEGLCVKDCDELPLSAHAGKHVDTPADLAA